MCCATQWAAKDNGWGWRCGTRAVGWRGTRSCGWNAVPGMTACAKCGGALVQRRDDNTDVVRERLRVYARDTRPLVEYYGGRPTFRRVDGAQPPDAVARDLEAAVASAAAPGWGGAA